MVFHHYYVSHTLEQDEEWQQLENEIFGALCSISWLTSIKAVWSLADAVVHLVDIAQIPYTL